MTGIDLKCPVHIQTHKVTSPHNNKPDQTKININGFDMAISAAQLLYGPVLVSCLLSQRHLNQEYLESMLVLCNSCTDM